MTENIVLTIQNAQFTKKDKTFHLNRYTYDKNQFIQTISAYIENNVKDTIRLVGIKCTSIMKI